MSKNATADFAAQFGLFLERSGYTTGQLAGLSGVPKTTLVNWQSGHVKKPRHWQDVLRAARALHLSQTQATRLLQAAGMPALSEFLARPLQTSDAALLDAWRIPTPSPSPARPFQAVRCLPAFIGRANLLDRLSALLRQETHERLYVLEGMAGIGKTALAAQLAYRLRPFLPDGVLWAQTNMAEPLQTLRLWAAAYGQDVSAYPDLHSRSQVVRALLADKRALLILDHVRASDEIDPLLPPAGPCAVLITTRHRNLAATRGALHVPLEAFDAAEALALFSHMVGEQTVFAAKDAFLEIAAAVGYLPLALDIIASRMAHEPGWTAEAFLDRLRQTRSWQKELTYEASSIYAVLELSYRLLPTPQQAFLTKLSRQAEYTFNAADTARYTATPGDAAQRYLRKLAGLSLIEIAREPDAYRLAPVVRHFAADKALNHPEEL